MSAAPRAGGGGVVLSPYYKDDAVTLYLGDCREILPQLEPVDHVIFDPPYSAHVDGNSVRGNGHKAGGRRQALGFTPMTPELMDAVSRYAAYLAKRWVIVFSDVESGHLWRHSLTEQGDALEFIRSGMWVKENATPQMTGDRPAIGVELITIAHRPGRKRWNGGGKVAVWTCATAYRAGDHVTHTTQKPVALLRDLILDFTDPGDLLLDPFGGSGTTAVAAKMLGRRCLVIEQQEQHCEDAARRFAGTDLDERYVRIKGKRGKQGAMDFGASPAAPQPDSDIHQ